MGTSFNYSKTAFSDYLEDILKNSQPRKKSKWELREMKPETKGQKMVNLLYMSAEDIQPLELKYKTWYQMYPKGKSSYGFSVMDGKIVDHPDRYKEGNAVDIEKYMSNPDIELVEIAKTIVL